MSRTAILTHADCDGICAGAIALCKFPGSSVFFTKPVSRLEHLKDTEADRIVILEIALNKRDAPEILEAMRGKNEIIYFDHHPVPGNISKRELSKITTYLHNRKCSASELAYRYCQDDIPKEMIWAAIYGAIGDYSEDTEFLKERIRSWDKRALYFEVSTIVLGIKNDKFMDYNAKRRIVRTMAAGGNPTDIPGLVKSAKEAVNREFQLYDMVKQSAMVSGHIGFVKDLPSFGFRGPSALFAATVKNKPVGMSIHTREKYIDITIRRRKNVPLNVLAESAAEACGGSGGGHESAAGARIPKGTLKRFLANANRMI